MELFNIKETEMKANSKNFEKKKSYNNKQKYPVNRKSPMSYTSFLARLEKITLEIEVICASRSLVQITEKSD